MRARLPLPGIVFLLTLSSQVWSQAPAVQWNRFYGNAGGAGAVKTIQTSDGGFLVGAQVFADGGMVSNYHGGEDIWLFKLDANGTIQWERCYGGSGNDRLSNVGHGGDIQPTSDGGYIMIGQSQSVDGDVNASIEGNHGGWDAWVVKLAANGNIQWQRSLGGSLDEYDYSIRQMPDGSYTLVGHTFSNDLNASGNHGQRDIWVVNLSSNGLIVQRQKCLGSSNYELNAKMDLTSDGGIIIGSASMGNDGDVSGNHHVTEFDYWVIKLNAAGTIEWQKCYGGRWMDVVTGIKVTPDGGYMVSGYTDSDDGDITGAKGGTDYWMVRIDATGNLLWQKTFGSWDWDIPFSISSTRNGNYIITGRTESWVDDGDVVGAKGSADLWTICINDAGNLLWQKTLGGVDWDEGTSAMQTADGGYIISGQTNSHSDDVATNPFPFSAWMLKFAPDALPVQLRNFSGRYHAGTNVLEWTTLHERNNASFILERSTDGVSFKPVATIAGRGQSDVPVDYHVTDNDILEYDKLYYRLKQVDIDGTITVSNIITLQRPYAFTQINGWQYKPEAFTIEVKAAKALSLVVNLRNAAGALIKQERRNVAEGRTRFDVALSNYSNGVYFIEVMNENERKTFRAMSR